MNFLKNFFMQHPIISLIAAFAIADRVEDHVMMNRALKNGMDYNGHRWRITNKPKTENVTPIVVEDDGK